MKPAVKWGRSLLLALLVAVLVAALSSADRTAEGKKKPATDRDIHLAAATQVTMGDTGQPRDIDLQRVHRTPRDGDAVNAFESKSWYVPPPPPPPPPPAKPQPPAPPTAPPLPFTYLGRLQESDKPLIFLVRGDVVLTVKEGDVIDNTYRVDGITGSTLNLTYLPLNIKQTMNIGATG